MSIQRPSRLRHLAGDARPTALAILLAGLTGAVRCPAQTMPDLLLRLTAQARSVPGVGNETTCFVELAWQPPSGSSRQGTVESNQLPDAAMIDDARGLVSLASRDVDPELETAVGSDVPLDPLERDEPGTPADGRSWESRLRDGKTNTRTEAVEVPHVLTPAFVRRSVDAALAAQGVVTALERLDGLSGRARTSAMLPETRFRIGHDTDASLRLSPTTDDPYRYSQTGGKSLLLEGSVVWRLGRLLFAGEELGIERLRLAQARERQRVTQVVLQELLAWHTAWRRVRAASGGSSRARDDLLESTLRLDLLTDGWFSAHQPGIPAATRGDSPSTEPKASKAPTSDESDGSRPTLPGPRNVGRRPPGTARRAQRKQPESSFAQWALETLALSR